MSKFLASIALAVTICGPSFAADDVTDAYLQKRPLLAKMSAGMSDEQKRCVMLEMTKWEQDASRPNITAGTAEGVIEACKS